MAARKLAALRADIRREQDDLARLVAEAEEYRRSITQWPEKVRLRTAGGILHDFYCGVERIFRHIAARLDEDQPSGPDWHIQLLNRMATHIEGVRPAVLDRETARRLDDYLRFRHLFRHIYGFELEWERCRVLFDDLPSLFEDLNQQLTVFDEFLQTLERQA